jgi:hypothetical protein
MLKQKCDCGSRLFFVNKKEKMIECSLCKQKYIINKSNEWIKIEHKKIRLPIITKNKVKYFVEDKLESIGEFRKRLGIKKIVKKIDDNTANDLEIKSYNKYKKELNIEKKQLEKKWESELNIMNNNLVISFDKNEHKGKLRGKHIAIKFHKDLKILGIENKLYFRKDKAFIELI